jgi:SlyX protein
MARYLLGVRLGSSRRIVADPARPALAPPTRLESLLQPQDAPMEHRFENLESKMMSAEDQIDELNRTVWRQQQELDVLREQFRQLAQQLKAMQDANPVPPGLDIPPHY